MSRLVAYDGSNVGGVSGGVVSLVNYEVGVVLVLGAVNLEGLVNSLQAVDQASGGLYNYLVLVGRVNAEYIVRILVQNLYFLTQLYIRKILKIIF